MSFNDISYTSDISAPKGDPRRSLQWNGSQNQRVSRNFKEQKMKILLADENV